MAAALMVSLAPVSGRAAPRPPITLPFLSNFTPPCPAAAAWAAGLPAGTAVEPAGHLPSLPAFVTYTEVLELLLLLLLPLVALPPLVLPLLVAEPLVAVWLLVFVAPIVLLLLTTQVLLLLELIVLVEPGPVLFILLAETAPVDIATARLAVANIFAIFFITLPLCAPTALN